MVLFIAIFWSFEQWREYVENLKFESSEDEELFPCSFVNINLDSKGKCARFSNDISFHNFLKFYHEESM